jgi:RNA polymerase sigma-70 factor (ECF subfamily)
VDLDEHLFRRESGRMVAALTRIFGVQPGAGRRRRPGRLLPGAGGVEGSRHSDNPAAWLMTTAKNRALDVVRRADGAHLRA